MLNKFKILLCLISLSAVISCTEEPYRPTIKQHVLSNIDILEDKLQLYINGVEGNKPEKALQALFLQCRLQYKHCEWAVEYYMPDPARFINGPALDELELEENREFPPHGFQVVEELLFPYDTANKNELLRESKVLLANVKQARTHLEAVAYTPEQVMDAVRLQVYRILALGITGFDCPIALSSIPETKEALHEIGQVVSFLSNEDKALDKDVLIAISKGITLCNSGKSFNGFDRASFIRQCLNPLSKALYLLQQKLNIPNVPRNRALRSEAIYLFAENAFDPDAFIPAPEFKFSKEKASLGKLLFYDKSLVNDNSRSCASCHQPGKAFTDGLRTNLSLTGTSLRRNTPSLTYASLQHGQFWDLRQPDLEKQTVDVIQNTDEMHGSMDDIVARLAAHPSYITEFKSVYKTDRPEAWQVQNALASYIRTLNAFNSRFDRYMRGDDSALKRNEIEGLNVFMGKGKCATCHFAPLFNGTVPPSLSKTEHEVLGTPQDAKETMLSHDTGRYIYNQMPQLKGAFKTPGLRNVAVTAPYMHNGVYRTLEEVVEFYDRGGGLGIGLPADNQTLPPDKLNLTAKEKADLIAFLHSLTDKQYETKKQP